MVCRRCLALLGDDERERAEWLLVPDNGSGGEDGEDMGNVDRRGPSILTLTRPSRFSSCRDSWTVVVDEVLDEGAVCRLGVSGELLA